MKPIIAITPEAVTLSRADGRGGFCGVSYSRAIEAAGGLPWVLPLTDDTAVLDACLERCDGLLLTGGGDVGHGHYPQPLQAKERAAVSGVDEVRDAMELYVVRRAWEIDLPTLGICRGIQVMNVAGGGSLLPDIPLRRPKALRHHGHHPWALVHAIRWQRGTRLARLLGRGAGRVNSTHHQAVDVPALEFVVAATAPDGIVEALEAPARRFFCGVQFHPERLLPAVPVFGKLFEALVKTSGTRGG